MITTPKPNKPLGGRAYGSIPHLPGSRTGPADHTISYGQALILTRTARDKHDRIIITEKLDGSNVAIARINGTLTPLVRAGYHALSSPFEQHHLFAHWVNTRQWDPTFLEEGQRLNGEWLAQAHGTTYANINHNNVFVPFDLMTGEHRHTYDEFTEQTMKADLTPAKLLHNGGPLPVNEALKLLGQYGHHGATEPAEGLVYRCERNNKVDFLAKFVRGNKIDGKHFPQYTGKPALWNWHPDKDPTLA